MKSVQSKHKPWSEAELKALRSLYADTTKPVDLASFAASIARDKSNVCRKARSLGLTNQRREKVVERKPRPARKFATDDERRAAAGERLKARIAERGHPRGAAGMKHSLATRAVIGDKSRAAWADPATGHHTEERRQAASDQILQRIMRGEFKGGYSRARGGRRADLGDVYFRSAWEANYARYLNFLVQRGEVLRWDYEPKTLTFDHIKRGTRAYIPDFRVEKPDGSHEWHEVKGWMDAKSKTRLARMARCYPDELVIVVDGNWFRTANKTLARLIPYWEHGTVRI